MAFSCMDGDLIKLSISLIRPRLEYTASVWSPKTKKNIKILKRVPRAATKIVPELKDLSYEEQLKKWNFQRLKVGEKGKT